MYSCLRLAFWLWFTSCSWYSTDLGTNLIYGPDLYESRGRGLFKFLFSCFTIEVWVFSSFLLFSAGHHARFCRSPHTINFCEIGIKEMNLQNFSQFTLPDLCNPERTSGKLLKQNTISCFQIQCGTSLYCKVSSPKQLMPTNMTTTV